MGRSGQALRTVGIAVAAALALGGAAARAADVLVEAESFSDLGGWVVDPQFMDIMGSPYLLAHGMGKPVTAARTQVEFPTPGTYYLWVRTKDWVPSHHPGTFKVIVDGVPAPAVFGNQGSGAWTWQNGGTVQVQGRKAWVELADLTGFEGRCDAIFFTSGTSSMPANEPGPAMAAWRRKLLGLPDTPPSAGEFDVVVVGGGIGGTAAAVTAARLGCTVALIQDRPVLGGNASQEIRVHTGGQAGPLVVSEINANYGGAAGTEPHPTIKFDERRLEVVQAEKNISLFLNWHAFAVSMQGNRIAAVDAKNVTSGEERRFAAPLFIDSTGDGSIGAWAGAEFRMGREARAEFNEPTAPEQADKMTLGTSLMWGTRETDHETTFPDVPWATEISKALAASGGDWTWETGHHLDTIKDAEQIRDHMFRAIYGAWSTAKNGADKEKYAKRELSWVPYVGGKRESRRIMGDYILTENDIVATREFPDGVATGSWSIDLHYPTGYDFRTTAKMAKVKPYPIPFRCLYSKDIENLMMAGRDISVTHVALGSTRVMNTHGQMGVAVGAAAWVCKKHGATPRGVYEKYLPELLAAVKGEGESKALLAPKTKAGADAMSAASHAGPKAAPPAAGPVVRTLEKSMTRCSDQYAIVDIPEAYLGLLCVTIDRGSFTAPAPGFSFEVDKPVTVYLVVHQRGEPNLPEGWQKTDHQVHWMSGPGATGKGTTQTDQVYRRDFPAGKVEIPGHNGADGRNYGCPHMAIIGDKDAKVTLPPASP